MASSDVAPRAAQPPRVLDQTTSKTLATLLADRTYHIEFNGYLTNHVKHALVALALLGAPATTVQRYWDTYTAATPYGLELEPARPPPASPSSRVTPANLREKLGLKESFAACEIFVQERLAAHGGDMGKVLGELVPVVAPGLAGALTHGIIHLGWALDAESPDMTVEGIAYMIYTFVDSHPERGLTGAGSGETPLESLLWLAKEAVLSDLSDVVAKITAPDHPKYSKAAGFQLPLADTGLQWKIAKVLEEGHGLLYRLPPWLESMPLQQVVDGLYRALKLVYLASAGQPERGDGNGNFVLLHLLTSLWGAERVLKAAPLSEQQQRDMLRAFWTVAVAVMAAADVLPSHSALAAVAAKFPDQACDATPQAVEFVLDKSWETTVPRAFAEEEEHNIKLVHVMRELWRRDGLWSGFRVAAAAFTGTPNVGPSQKAFNVPASD